MPDPASITLSREGVTVTVKVGDVVPMTDGSDGTVININGDHLRLRLVRSGITDWWYCANGTFAAGTRGHRFPAIDLAALAAPARAAPAVPTERVLALEVIIGKWDAEAKALARGNDWEAGNRAAYKSCAADVRRWIKALTNG